MSDLDRYAVLGQPVGHSKSPRIHAAFAASLGQKLLYEAYEIAPDELGPSLSRFHAEGWAGFNLTVPHKQAGAALCESRSEAAEQAGAVNTLIRTATGWHGDNTDGAGLVRDLTANLGVAIKGKRVLLLGAGGAARGILVPLLAEGPAELAISNRNPWKPEEIAAALKPHGNIVPRTHLSLKGDRYDLVINATSISTSYSNCPSVCIYIVNKLLQILIFRICWNEDCVVFAHYSCDWNRCKKIRCVLVCYLSHSTC